MLTQCNRVLAGYPSDVLTTAIGIGLHSEASGSPGIERCSSHASHRHTNQAIAEAALVHVKWETGFFLDYEGGGSVAIKASNCCSIIVT